jgi:hypothetical protein
LFIYLFIYLFVVYLFFLFFFYLFILFILFYLFYLFYLFIIYLFIYFVCLFICYLFVICYLLFIFPFIYLLYLLCGYGIRRTHPGQQTCWLDLTRHNATVQFIEGGARAEMWQLVHTAALASITHRLLRCAPDAQTLLEQLTALCGWWTIDQGAHPCLARGQSLQPALCVRAVGHVSSLQGVDNWCSAALA